MTRNFEHIQDVLDSEAKEQVTFSSVDNFATLEPIFHQQLATLREFTDNGELEKDAVSIENDNQIDLLNSFDSVSIRPVQRDERLTSRMFKFVNFDKNTLMVKTRAQKHLASMERQKYLSSQTMPRWDYWQSSASAAENPIGYEKRQLKVTSTIAQNSEKVDQVRNGIREMFLEKLLALEEIRIGDKKHMVFSEKSIIQKKNFNDSNSLEEVEVAKVELNFENKVYLDQSKIEGKISNSVFESVGFSNKNSFVEKCIIETKEMEMNQVDEEIDLSEYRSILIHKSLIKPFVIYARIQHSLHLISLSGSNDHSALNQNSADHLAVLEFAQPAHIEHFILETESLPGKLFILLTKALKMLSSKKNKPANAALQKLQFNVKNDEKQIPMLCTINKLKNKLVYKESIIQSSNFNDVSKDFHEDKNDRKPVIINNNNVYINSGVILKSKIFAKVEGIVAPQKQIEQSNQLSQIMYSIQIYDTHLDYSIFPAVNRKLWNELLHKNFDVSLLEQNNQNILLTNTENNSSERGYDIKNRIVVFQENEASESYQDSQRIDLKANRNFKMENAAGKNKKLSIVHSDNLKVFKYFSYSKQISIIPYEILFDNYNKSLPSNSIRVSINSIENIHIKSREIELHLKKLNLHKISDYTQPKKTSFFPTMLLFLTDQNKFTSHTSKNFINNKNEKNLSISPNMIDSHNTNIESKIIYKDSSAIIESRIFTALINEINSKVNKTDLQLHDDSIKNINLGVQYTTYRLVRDLTVSNKPTEKADTYSVKLRGPSMKSINNPATVERSIKYNKTKNNNFLNFKKFDEIKKHQKIFHNLQQKESENIIRLSSSHPLTLHSRTSEFRSRSVMKKVLDKRSIKWSKTSISPKKYESVKNLALSCNKIPITEVQKGKGNKQKNINENKIVESTKNNVSLQKPECIFGIYYNGSINRQKSNNKTQLIVINNSNESIRRSKNRFSSKIPIRIQGKRTTAKPILVDIEKHSGPELPNPSMVYSESQLLDRIVRSNQALDNRELKTKTLLKKESINNIFNAKEEQNEKKQLIAMYQEINPIKQSPKLEFNSDFKNSEHESISGNPTGANLEYRSEKLHVVMKNDLETSLQKFPGTFKEALRESQKYSRENSEEAFQKESDLIDSNESRDSLNIQSNGNYLFGNSSNKAEISKHEYEEELNNEYFKKETSESISTKLNKNGCNAIIIETTSLNEVQSGTLTEHYTNIDENVEISTVPTANLYTLEKVEQKCKDSQKTSIKIPNQNLTLRNKNIYNIPLSDEIVEKNKPKKRYSMIANFVQQFESDIPRVTKRTKKSVNVSKQNNDNHMESFIGEREVSRQI